MYKPQLVDGNSVSEIPNRREIAILPRGLGTVIIIVGPRGMESKNTTRSRSTSSEANSTSR